MDSEGAHQDGVALAATNRGAIVAKAAIGICVAVSVCVVPFFIVPWLPRHIYGALPWMPTSPRRVKRLFDYLPTTHMEQ
jgi:hypothetical protein